MVQALTLYTTQKRLPFSGKDRKKKKKKEVYLNMATGRSQGEHTVTLGIIFSTNN